MSTVSAQDEGSLEHRSTNLGGPCGKACVRVLIALLGLAALAFFQPSPLDDLRVVEAHSGHCGNVAPPGEVWSAGVHTVTCNVTVGSGSTLNIEAGAIVKFELGTRLNVQGGSRS